MVRTYTTTPLHISPHPLTTKNSEEYCAIHRSYKSKYGTIDHVKPTPPLPLPIPLPSNAPISKPIATSIPSPVPSTAAPQLTRKRTISNISSSLTKSTIPQKKINTPPTLSTSSIHTRSATMKASVAVPAKPIISSNSPPLFINNQFILPSYDQVCGQAKKH